MNLLVKKLADRFYKPVLSKYLSVTRKYTYKGVSLLVPPEVFHPAFFFSTKYLLHFINQMPLEKKTFMELGAGSGLISLFVAGKGAHVTATDINPVAVEYLEKNSAMNNRKLEVIHSDLFNDIPVRIFDIIAINPPYFKKNPETYAQHAWYCGENGEYFERLFKALPNYINPSSTVLIHLSDGCDLPMITGMANKNGYRLNCVKTNRNILEKNFIFKVERS